MVREFTQDELDKLSSLFDGVAEQNMSYGICIKRDGHIVKWLTFNAAQQSQADVCPSCRGLKIVRNDDGLGSKVCPALQWHGVTPQTVGLLRPLVDWRQNV